MFVGGKTDERARWFEPYGGDIAWRLEIWGQMVALNGPLSTYLAYLRDKLRTTTLTPRSCAHSLSGAQRSMMVGGDPREELAFHVQLAPERYAARR